MFYTLFSSNKYQFHFTNLIIFYSILTQVPSDEEISQSQNPKDISDLALEIGLLPDELETYGNFKGKVSLDVLHRLKERENANYVVVTGKTTLSAVETNSSYRFWIFSCQLVNNYW